MPHVCLGDGDVRLVLQGDGVLHLPAITLDGDRAWRIRQELGDAPVRKTVDPDVGVARQGEVHHHHVPELKGVLPFIGGHI